MKNSSKHVMRMSLALAFALTACQNKVANQRGHAGGNGAGDAPSESSTAAQAMSTDAGLALSGSGFNGFIDCAIIGGEFLVRLAMRDPAGGTYFPDIGSNATVSFAVAGSYDASKCAVDQEKHQLRCPTPPPAGVTLEVSGTISDKAGATGALPTSKCTGS